MKTKRLTIDLPVAEPITFAGLKLTELCDICGGTGFRLRPDSNHAPLVERCGLCVEGAVPTEDGYALLTFLAHQRQRLTVLLRDEEQQP